MKKVLFTIGIVFFMANAVFALTGRQIMDKSDALPEPSSSKMKATMTIKKGSRTMVKVFKTISKKVNGNTLSRATFIRPTRIELLTHSFKHRDDDQWLKLSSGKVKRIAGSDKGKAFVNSHFFYEDLQSRNINDYNYKLVGDAIVNKQECYKVEAIKKNNKSKVYSKTVLYVRKADFFVIKIKFFKKGKLLKYLKNYNIVKIKGILTPLKVVMYQGNKKGKTVLKMNKKDIKYNIRISTSRFSKDAF